MKQKEYCPRGRHLYNGAGACALCGTVMAEATEQQQGSPSKSSDLLRCPVCERYKCREYQEPIDYTVCSSCLSVIVLGKDGTVSLLSHARAL